MSKRKKSTNHSALKPGEVIRIQNLLPGIPGGVFEFLEQSGNFLRLRCGEIEVGCDRRLVKILDRHLPQPFSWLAEEVAKLRQSVRDCGCEECQKLLEKKELMLSQ